MDNTGRQEYWLADYIKLFLAFIVVAIHTGLVSSVQIASAAFFIEYVESLAVPIFFAITGFLLEENLSRNAGKENEVIKTNIVKYVKLYLKLSAIYLPLTLYGVYQQLLDNVSVKKAVFRMIKNYILVGEQFYSWPLWYLLATIIGLAALLVVPERRSWRLLLYGCGCFAAAYIINYFSDARIIAITVKSGRMLTGPSYIMLGMLANREKKLFSPKAGLLVPILTCGCSVLFGLPYSTTSIMAFLAVPWIIGFIMSYSADEVLSKHSKSCRKVSAIIYFSHMYVCFIWMYVLPIREKGIYCFLFVAALSFLFSVIVCRLNGKKQAKSG